MTDIPYYHGFSCEVTGNANEAAVHYFTGEPGQVGKMEWC